MMRSALIARCRVLMMKQRAVLVLVAVAFIVAQSPTPSGARQRRSQASEFPDWKTNTEKRSIDLYDLISPGMPKDGIPAIDHPRFVPASDAASWLSANEPVIVVQLTGIVRAYPLEILIWHEVCDYQIGAVPVAL